LSVVPSRIFCPSCGEPVRTEGIAEREVVEVARKWGFIATARFHCVCGVVGIINVKRMPESPTWTIAFDKYVVKKEVERVA